MGKISPDFPVNSPENPLTEVINHVIIFTIRIPKENQGMIK